MFKFLFFLLFFPFFSFSQQNKFQLLDFKTKTPLMFVEVLSNGKKAFSDKNGNILLDSNADNIIVLDSNYSPSYVEISPESKVIYLENNVTELQEMIISKKPRTIIKPQSKKIFDHFFIDLNRIYLNEITFNTEFQNKYLRKLSFKSVSEIYGNFNKDLSQKDARSAKKTIRNTTQLLRINIYDHNFKVLFTSNPFEYKTKGEEFFEVDIDDEILIVDNPIYIEIEILGALNEAGGFIENVKNISLRPQQTKLPPKEFKTRLLIKEKYSNSKLRDLVKEKIMLESYINFGFELEDK